MNKLHDVDVIVFNSHGVGQVCEVERLPRRGETMEAKNWRVEEDGGKGATVSVALGRLGVKTGYIGKVGDDPWGEMGNKWMSESGVDTTYMYVDPNVATGTGLIMIDKDGLNTIVDGDSACQYLTEEEIFTAIDNLSSAKYFITGFGMPYKISLLGAKYAKEKYNLTTFCNASPLPNESLGDLSYIDYIVLNDIEAKVLLNLPENSEDDFNKIAKEIQKRHNLHGVIITMGDKGSVILDNDNYIEINPTKVEAVYTIGAGDGYLAAIVAALNWGYTLKDAAKFASNYSAFKVTREGTMTKEKNKGYPFIEEVKEFISTIGEQK